MVQKERNQVLVNARSEVEFVEHFVEQLGKTDDTRKLWLAWAGVLDHYVKAVAALRRATVHGSTKIWSDKLLSEQKADSILRYVFEARNHDNHVFESRREVSPKAVSVGGAIVIQGGQNITLKNNTIIDSMGRKTRLPDGTFSVENGRVTGGNIHESLFEKHDHFIVLSDIKTRSGDVCAVPSIGNSPQTKALDISAYVLQWLKRKLK